MIRINLLPVREAAQQKTGRQFAVLILTLLVLEVFVLFFLQSEKEGELNTIQRQNARISKKIKGLQKKTSAVSSLEAQHRSLKQQKQVLDSIIEGQSGPVRMLDELSRTLSPIEDPKLKLEVQTRGWNPDWDPKRLWIDSFVEKQRVVHMSGHARNNEDLAEFLRRLNSSRHFVEVALRISETETVREAGNARMVRFDIQALAIYGPADLRKLISGELGVDDDKKKK